MVPAYKSAERQDDAQLSDTRWTGWSSLWSGIPSAECCPDLWTSFCQWRSESLAERRTRTALMSLTDRQLKDIGIARPEIMRVARYGREVQARS